MNLTSAEDSAYKAIYNKIASSTTFSKGTCIKLMVKRGQIPQDIANQVFTPMINKPSQYLIF